MRIAVLVIGLCLAGCAGHVSTEPQRLIGSTHGVGATIYTDGHIWTRVADVQDVAISHAIDAGDLVEGEAARSTLYRDRETGAYRCVVIYRPLTPQVQIDHEHAHCHGWDHRAKRF